VYDPIPPDVFNAMVPSHTPTQSGKPTDGAFNIGEGSMTLTVVEPTQLFTSVTCKL
jgi:hypothetical protein